MKIIRFFMRKMMKILKIQIIIYKKILKDKTKKKINRKTKMNLKRQIRKIPK